MLGGYNLAISAYSRNADAAFEFANYATAPAAQKKFFVQSSLPAVLTQTYKDAERQEGGAVRDRAAEGR